MREERLKELAGEIMQLFQLPRRRLTEDLPSGYQIAATQIGDDRGLVLLTLCDDKGRVLEKVTVERHLKKNKVEGLIYYLTLIDKKMHGGSISS